MYNVDNQINQLSDMYILGIGPESLPTTLRVDYIVYVVSSFFLPSGYVFRNYPVSICDGVWQVKIGKWKELFFIR